MSKCRNVPIIILLCVKNPVPEWLGFTTWLFGFAEPAGTLLGAKAAAVCFFSMINRYDCVA